MVISGGLLVQSDGRGSRLCLPFARVVASAGLLELSNLCLLHSCNGDINNTYLTGFACVCVCVVKIKEKIYVKHLAYAKWSKIVFNVVLLPHTSFSSLIFS